MIKNTLIGISFVCSMVCLLILLYQRSYRENFIYVDTLKLYSEFEYTKQTNKELEKIVNARKQITDSLYETVRKKTQELKYKKSRSDEDMSFLSGLQDEYFYKKEQFENENQSTVELYNTKIWNQLNTFIQEYGKENHYQLIFGANAQGTIMYGMETLDKTKEIIDFVNKRFNDKN